MNKKSMVTDLVLIGLIIFTLSIVFLVGGKLIGDVNDNYQLTNASTDAKGIMQKLTTRFTGIFDYIFATVFFLSIIALFVSFFMIDNHPAFFFVTIIIIGFLVIPIAIMGNVYHLFSNTSDFSGVAGDMGIMNWIMNNWVTMLVVLGFVGIILLYAKIKASNVI